jgi:CheY-like chemotaxis protein
MRNPISILVVDDIPSMAESLADVLEARGFITYPACSGLEALKILQEHPVDILLTDVIMPGMNGVALYRKTRKDYPRLTTFLMTAYAADELIQRGMMEGIKTVLNKPIDIELLFTLCTAVAGLIRNTG